MYDPTEAGHIPVYDLHDIPIPPPPPTRKKRRTLLFGIALLVALSGAVVAISLAITPDSALQPTPTPTPTPTGYTASTIVQAFQNAGLPTDYLLYGESLNRWFSTSVTNVQEQSSATFLDTHRCLVAMGCQPGNIWLGVYTTVLDARSAGQDDLAREQNAELNGPTIILVYQHGRCLLDGELDTSGYAQIVKKDCI